MGRYGGNLGGQKAVKARPGRRLAVGAALVAIAMALPAVANAQTAYRSVRVESGAEVLALAAEAQSRGDLEATEKLLRAVLQDSNREVSAEARFRLAKLAAAAGRLSEAAVMLRRVLDDFPRAAPARLELAAVLSKMGSEDLALRELRSVRTTDLPPNVARFVDRWSASLQASKKSGVQFEMSVAPDSNINHATASDTLGTVFGDFLVDEGSKSRSGVGLSARALAHQRMPIGPGLNLVARAAATTDLYPDKDFNDISAEISLGPELKLAGTRFTADVSYGRRWYGMRAFQHQWRLSGSATRPLGSVTQVRIDGSYRRTDNLMNDLQDGQGMTFAVRLERALLPDLSVSAFVTADRFRARDDAYSTRSRGAGVSVYRDIGRMTLSVAAEIGKLEADERLSIFPHARKDRYVRFTLGGVFRQLTFAGFAPIIRIVRERNKSTVEFYDFERLRTEFGVSRAF